MITLHVLAILVSYVAFLIAVVTGVAFLVQERRLKLKDPRVLRSKSVPIELLDQVNLWAVIVGFVLFSFGMIHGYVLAKGSWGAFWNWDPSEIWSGLTWAAYAGVLGLRLRVGLRGRRVVLMSVMSFLFALFAFVGLFYFTEGRHLFF